MKEKNAYIWYEQVLFRESQLLHLKYLSHIFVFVLNFYFKFLVPTYFVSSDNFPLHLSA
jgi:phosphate starvation-inducible membrane PsiE